MWEGKLVIDIVSWKSVRKLENKISEKKWKGEDIWGYLLFLMTEEYDFWLKIFSVGFIVIFLRFLGHILDNSRLDAGYCDIKSCGVNLYTQVYRSHF